MTDDELERTLVQMPGDFAVIREAARRFVPGGREARATVRDLQEQLDEAERETGRLTKRASELDEECDRLAVANEILNDLVETLSRGGAG